MPMPPNRMKCAPHGAWNCRACYKPAPKGPEPRKEYNPDFPWALVLIAAVSALVVLGLWIDP